MWFNTVNCLCSVIISAAESLADAQEQETSRWRPTGLMKEGCLGAGLARDDGGSSVQKREPDNQERARESSWAAGEGLPEGVLGGFATWNPCMVRN